MAFHAMSENLMEEHTGGAAGKNGGSDERIDDGRLQQADQVLGDAVDGAFNHVIFWKPLRIEGFKSFRSAQIHSIVSSGDSRNDDSREAASMLEALALRGGQVLGLRLRRHAH